MAQILVGKGNYKSRERLEKKYPTAALAAISSDLDKLRSLGAGTGTLQLFVTPKDIIADNDD